MTYTIRNRVNYSDATIDFFIQFSEDDGFLDYLVQRKGLKGTFNALSVAASKQKNALRVRMPFGTNEKTFEKHAKVTIQMLYSMFEARKYAGNGCDLGNIFGNIFGGRRND